MKKKVIIIILVIIAFISSTSYITFKVISGNAKNGNQISNPIEEDNLNEIITEDEKDVSTENLEESKIDDSDHQNEEVKEEPIQGTSNNENTTSNNSNNNNNIAKQEEVPTQNNTTQASTPAPTKSCTPKKFYSTFRADEDIKSMDDCNSIGTLYKSVYGYIGYSCDYQTDDCGDLYYMLQMIDADGHEHGYNTIPKP